jgi:hypothetical protein
MRIRECLHLLVMGYEPEEVVIRMELNESEARDIAIKVNSWLDKVQLDSRRIERFKM